jgi:hypothetical protein
MPSVRKRCIWWEFVPEATSYVVYASTDKSVFDPAAFLWEATPGILFKSVQGKTQLIIPDDWPEFPKEPGMYHIGITSRDDVGNESDPFLSSGLFRFTPPPPPSKGGIDNL